MIVQEIRRLKNGHYRLVFAENTLDVTATMLADYYLYRGKDLTETQLITVQNAYQMASCRERALVLLSYRDHFIAELSAKLRQRGYADDIIDQTVGILCSEGLIDESRRARHVVSCDGQRLGALQLKQRLYRMGCPAVLIDQVLREDPSDQVSVALFQLQKKTRGETRQTIAAKREKLLHYLIRRGFSYGDAKCAFHQLVTATDVCS